MKFIEYPDRELLMMDLADVLVSELKSTLLTHERATFCVPGGTTPGPVFDVLSGVDLDWGRIGVLLSDERWVPETDSRSNTRLLRERLLIDKAAQAPLIPLYVDQSTPEEAVESLGNGITPHLPISVLLLGMGTDMHTASLFPEADNLVQALSDDAPPLMVMRPPNTQETRISLTAPALKSALSTHILITGEAKRAALERSTHLSVQEAPIKTVLGQATVHWAE